MAIVPGSQPIQGQSNEIPAYQPLPTEQIARSTQRLTKRLRNARDSMSKLKLRMAQQQVHPNNTEQFDAATEGIRQRLRKISEEGDVFNRMPEIRQEAMRFSQVANAFKQNKAALEESQKRLQEANLDPTHEALYRKKLQQMTPVKLNEDNTVDPESIASPLTIQEERNPKEYLDETLSNLEPEKQTRRARGDGVIEKAERDVLSRERLVGQGLRELGFGLKDPSKGLQRGNIEMKDPRNADPKVQRWLSREREVAQATEDPESYLQDRIYNMVNDVANRYKQEDDWEYTVKSDPRVDDSDGGDGSSDSGDIVVPGAGVSVRNEQAKTLEKEVREDYLDKRFNENQNISRNQYQEIDRLRRKNQKPGLMFSPEDYTGGMGTSAARSSSTQVNQPTEDFKTKVVNQYGQDTYEAYKAIRKGKEGLDRSVGQFAIEQDTFQFDPGSEASNTIKKRLIQSGTSALSSPQVNEEQLRYLLSDDNNFNLMRMSKDRRYILINPKDSAISDAPGGEWLGPDNMEAGKPIKIRVGGIARPEGTQEEGLRSQLTKGLPEDVRQTMEQADKVSGKAFSTEEWKNAHGNIDIKVDNLNMTRDPEFGRATMDANYVARAGNEEVTFGNLSQKIVNSENISKQEKRKLISDLAAAANNVPAVRQAQKEGQIPGIDASMMNKALRGAAGDLELREGPRQIIDLLMKSPIPAEEAGKALSWGELFQELGN